MPRLEVTFKPEFKDARGESVKNQIQTSLGIKVDSVHTIDTYQLDVNMSPEQLKKINELIFLDPITQVSSYKPLAKEFDYIVLVGFLPGVKDNVGRTSQEAIEDLLKIKFKENESVYTSVQYLIKGKITAEDCERIAKELLANDMIQRWQIFSKDGWNLDIGIGEIIPKVSLQHKPQVKELALDVSDNDLMKLSRERCLALNLEEMKTIQSYYKNSKIIEDRKKVGLSEKATDIEIEVVAQTQSDHCKHKSFAGLFDYTDFSTGKKERVDNLFKSFIKRSTEEISAEKDWVISTLWDNAGVMDFDGKNAISIKSETHNSPSNMEAYGGAITGIVGVYRDPMGTSKGSKIIAGTYGFCVGSQFYDGELKPRLHPRRLLEGVRLGVEHGGNKSGIPTPFGSVLFDDSYLGKCLVYVGAFGIMPREINGKPTHKKTTKPGQLIIMCGGRIGKDGIHGVTASSEEYHEGIPTGHVQIGDPYTQKKMHDFLIEVRDSDIIEFIQDCGGGGVSSAIGETASYSNGCIVHLDKMPLKYDGLDPWEIFISESQERMVIAIEPENKEIFFDLAKKHDVEATVVGEYNDLGYLNLTFGGKTVAYVTMDFLHAGFPQWAFDAEWTSPEMRGLFEPVLDEPKDHNQLLRDILARPNIVTREELIRQYDHEVQGTSVIKPLCGRNADVMNNACVLRPILDSNKGISISATIPSKYSRIDTYYMTTYAINEAIQRIVAVGGSLKQIALIDNFCWPCIIYDPKTNPDAKYKAAQLVRSTQALYKYTKAFGTPCLSGKDSMYVDGNLLSKYGQTQKVSAIPTLQMTAVGKVEDVLKCQTLDFKSPGDSIYVVGETRDELGASEYYEMRGYLGLNVPKINSAESIKIFNTMSKAIENGVVSSVSGIYRGGFGVALSQSAFAGELGVEVDLSKVKTDLCRNDKIIYSETGSRFIVSVSPKNKAKFEQILEGIPFSEVGKVCSHQNLIIRGVRGQEIVNANVLDLKKSWQTPYK
jgi:phosphoribosylformylglycinamidine synthase subunit PurSL